MERLTYRDANGELWYSDNGTERDRLHRLAAYEDTGLAPVEVRQMRWIPVEERLPEEQGQYIVFVDGKVTTDFYWVCEDIKWWLSYNGGFNALYIDPYSSKPKREPPYPRVTHWMPLPQPPKEGTNGKH